MFERGFLKVGSFGGAPVRLHWTIPVGAMLFGGRAFAPAFWIGFVVLVLGHELGHATVVRYFRHRNVSVDVTGFGGMCRWSGNATPFERAVIAWGGVAVQAIMALVAAAVFVVVGWPSNPHIAQLFDLFLRANLMLIALNLLPFAPLDGAVAWNILRYLPQKNGSQKNTRRAFQRTSSRSSGGKPKHSRPGFFRSGNARGKTKTESQNDAKIIDMNEYSRMRNRTHARSTGSGAKSLDNSASMDSKDSKQLADELIRLAQEAAEARRKRNEN